MYRIFDISAVNSIFEGAAPRRMIDVMRETYPDATFDAKGRAHAPHDGYTCQLTGCEFRAGEFLPMVECEEKGARFSPRVFATDGDHVFVWSGTSAQTRKTRDEVKRQSTAIDAANSRHIGEVGRRIHLNVTVCAVVKFDGSYGPVFVTVGKDGDNVIVAKGVQWVRDRQPIRPGDTIALTATVKDHSERDGIAQTLVQRIKIAE